MRIHNEEKGNVLVCTLCTILIVSLIGANVLYNCTTRYNSTTKQVKAWKDALTAAEAGGDIGYAACRKLAGVDTTVSAQVALAFPTSEGWASAGTNKWSRSYTGFGQSNSLSTTVTVDQFQTGAPYFRIRSTGTARVFGLQRTAMDDRMDSSAAFDPTKPFMRGAGSSLLRKIDFKVDHFKATYGDGDSTAGTILSSPVPNPQLSRRIELVAVPSTLFEAAIKASGNFTGMGNAAYIDSFRSTVGPYNSSVKTNPADSRYVDARSGTVEVNTGIAAIGGKIYGNVLTNGGSVTWKTTNVLGVIDNTVPFPSSTYSMPDTTAWDTAQAHTGNYSQSASGNTTFSPTVGGSASAPVYYVLNNFNNSVNMTVNAAVVGGVTQETYVAVRVNDDLGTSNGNGPSFTVPAHVHLKIYYTGNFNTKASAINNNSGYAANLQFLNISANSTAININSPGDFSALFYAPNSDMTINGNPDITGAAVVHNFSANGNVGWHYDRAIESDASSDYRVASYIEDVR